MSGLARSIALGAAALGLSLPSAAWANDFWEVKRSASGACSMASLHNNPDGRLPLTLIAFVYDPSLAALSFFGASPRWGEASGQDGNPQSLHLKFDGAGHNEWIVEQAALRRVGSDRRVLVGDWGSENSDELARALTTSQRLTVTYGGSELGTFDLSDANTAYGDLRKCAARG